MVDFAANLPVSPKDGRLILVLGGPGNLEPRRSIGDTGMDAAPLLGIDAKGLAKAKSVAITDQATLFPFDRLDQIPKGKYRLQAVLLQNPDDRRANAPLNLVSAIVEAEWPPARPVRLSLNRQLPGLTDPPETDRVKYVSLESHLLTRFRGRKSVLRAGVVLPKSFAQDPAKRYPLVVVIGGYGTPYTAARGDVSDLDKSGVDAVLMHVDGTGPFGDTNQVNSENNGPCGDALTQELIPFVESRFRCIGKPEARFTTGGSTGGWVSFALQVLYPDFFNGCWSYFPDPVDFRQFQLVDLYKDANAFVNSNGFERPSARTIGGDTQFTIRHECRLENVLGDGGSFVTSGGQWCSWNATFGPKGKDGHPTAIWDPVTGAVNRSVLDTWRKKDLRLQLETNWKALGPRLKGKIRIAVGDADEYFLNNAVVLLEDFLKKADPPYEGRIVYGSRKGHGWVDIPFSQALQEMTARMKATLSPNF